MHDTQFILLIEDDPSTQALMTEVLNEENYIVHSVADAESARHVLRECTPNLILCDFRLPGTSGLTFARAVRHAGQRMPIILMTADGTTVRDLDLSAVSSCLYKPFHLHALLECVAAHIEPHTDTSRLAV